MGGHLRIEMRTLPAGPTPQDMVANAAFLIGLSLGLRSDIEDLLTRLPFEYAHSNFYRAAQHGLDATLLWPSPASPSPQEVPVKKLVLELLPVAEQGLASLGVHKGEIRRMLDVLRARLNTGITGARWQIRLLDQLEQKRLSRQDALDALLEVYLRESTRGCPVTEWSTEP